MRETNITRAEVAITNQIRCHPPKDFLEGAPWEYSAKLHCTTNYLEPAIRELKPRVILALGGTAFRALVAAPKGRQGTLDYIRGYAMPGAGAATGIPVVTTISTGSRDSVVPEVTGLLIPPGYPEAIAEAVLKLLRDPERRVRMGKAARAWVLKHYVDERVLGLTVAYYKRLLEPAVV